jgi:single-stranded-DNA-specific exonuclease
MSGQPEIVDFELAPAPFAATVRLEQELGLSHVMAQVLARRGFADPATARAFLEAGERHQPAAFSGIAAAVELVLSHVRRGSVITVHGDYDCDGVCSTAILLSALRELGADVDWYLPDRLGDGYGLSPATVERLASRGTRLLITADCAITAIDAVAAARSAGLDVLVTDHHAPRADGSLPDAPIVHPALCAYPCEHLCATAVAMKLAQALRGGAGLDEGERPDELELVALATVADVVPLLGENRRLVREGLRALSRTGRIGLRSLMAVAQVDPLRIGERQLAFALAPRINAAGRIARADVALELLLTDDPQRAAQLAAELDRLNGERRNTETRIRFEAEAQVAATGPAAAYVLAGEGWHPGVVGIVAARIAERHHRPAVLLALAEDGAPAVGSARSIAAFDLLEGLRASSDELIAYGGHRAAAGLQLECERIDAFREAFVAHAERVLGPEQLARRERADAVVDAQDIGLELADELTGLGPFGCANPPVSLLFRAATIDGVSGFGGEGRGEHARFTLRSGRARARAVAFGSGTRLGIEPGQAVDAAFALERHEWQGAVEPRLVLRTAAPCAPEPLRLVGEPEDRFACALTELDRDLAALPLRGGGVRELNDRRGRGIGATLGELVASNERVLVLCASAPERRRHLDGRLGGFDMCDYAALEREPALTDPYAHVVLLDPPSCEAQLALAQGGRGVTHLAWGEAELRFAAHIHVREYQLRGPLAACYRALRLGGSVSGGKLAEVLSGDAREPWSVGLAGRVLRVLSELELIAIERDSRLVRVISTAGTSLEHSPAYRAYCERLEDGLRYLEPSKEQAA